MVVVVVRGINGVDREGADDVTDDVMRDVIDANERGKRGGIETLLEQEVVRSEVVL